nr:CHASE4 domain-containing protein [uncultured Anaeromusa sp.]
MSIRQKTFLICAGFAFVGLLTVVVLVRLFFGIHMENVERQAFTRDAQRMVRAVAYEVDVVSDFAADWAAWDEMYAYVQGGNNKFEETYLNKSVFQQQKLNWMALSNKEGTLLFLRTYDGNREMFWPAAVREQEVVQRVLAQAALRQQNVLSGVLRLPQGPLLFSVQRVMNSKKTAQGDGWLFTGRYLGGFQGDPIRWAVDGQVSWSVAEGGGATAWLDDQGHQNVPFRI